MHIICFFVTGESTLKENCISTALFIVLYSTLAHTSNEKLSLVQNHGNQKLSNLLTKKGPLPLSPDDSDNYNRFFLPLFFCHHCTWPSAQLDSTSSWLSLEELDDPKPLELSLLHGAFWASCIVAVPHVVLTPDFFPLMSLTRWALQTPLVQDESQTPPRQATLWQRGPRFLLIRWALGSSLATRAFYSYFPS